ncbi:MAG: elongation factor P [Deltaproteobacteria bacterium]|nr:elongation factor P [Deltaproteobacteria bacterium]
MYSASDLRKGLRFKLDGEPHLVVDFDFVKPGKGQALYKCRLKNLITGSQFERSFRSVDNFEEADIQEKEMQYLYFEGDKYCFMDNETFEQLYLNADQVGEAKNFLLENLVVEVMLFEGRSLGITLPNSVDVIVTEALPWIKGDTVSGNNKPVKIETGYQLQVPVFVEQGEKIRVDTRTGEYVTRVKD